MNAMAMYYKHDLSYNFIDFNENIINRNETVEEIKRVNVQNDLYLGNQKFLHNKNGIIWLLGQWFTIMYYNIIMPFEFLFYEN